MASKRPLRVQLQADGDAYGGVDELKACQTPAVPCRTVLASREMSAPLPAVGQSV
jgi:hypothetical protein